MKRELNVNTQITLTLTREEADWLHRVMQNPLSEDSDPTNEYPLDRIMRAKFFEATKIPEET